jgi:UDP-N-acetylmuramate--alanine ligase
LLLDIYAAGEHPLPGISTTLLYDGIKEHGQREVHYMPVRSTVAPFLRQYLREGAILLTLGAGDVWKVGQEFLQGDVG